MIQAKLRSTTQRRFCDVATSAANLGHTDVLTTLRSYGQIDRDRQRALITGMTGDDVLE